MRGRNKVTGLEVGGQEGSGTRNHRGTKHTASEELWVPGVLRAAVKGPLGSRNVREREVIGSLWETIIERNVGFLK